MFTIFIFPILLLLLSAILVKNLLHFGFKISGVKTALVIPERICAVLLLLCADAAAVIFWWYPRYVITHNAAPDDRFGFFIVGAFQPIFRDSEFLLSPCSNC